MSFIFKVDDDKQLIEVQYTGLVSCNERIEAIKEGVSILKNKGYTKILINLLGAKMQLAAEEKVKLAQFISEQHALIKAKTAFLIRCEQIEREEIDEVVLRTDDFVSQVFYARSLAENWLMT